MTEPVDYAAKLRAALAAMQKQQASIERLESAQSEPIAVVGMGCRFPGAEDGPESFWELLRDGVDAIREVSPQRWPIDDFFDPDPDAPGKMSTRWGGFLEEVDRFDARFFRISPREAIAMDPQQRLLLEVSWEALEHAAIDPGTLRGTATAVYVGLTTLDYAKVIYRDDLARLDAYCATGNVANVASGRLSYFYGLRGPSLTVDTACSSSLVAVHLACQSLRNGEANVALAAGVNLMLAPDNTIAVSRAHMLAPDGRCKTFDRGADGYARSEGCGVVVLKRLSAAIAGGDRILAVVRGSAVRQDGARSGLTVPNGPAQEAVIHAALANARVSPADVGYVEAHGTGTSLGDPIEVEALGNVFGQGRDASRPLLIGALKTNLGHMESAAGVGGIIKTVLGLQHGEIPRNLHLRAVHADISLQEIPAVVPVRHMAWPAAYERRLAGVSGFGSSGTVAHVVLEAPPRPQEGDAGDDADKSAWLLPISAATPAALAQMIARYEAFLARTRESFADICHTAAVGRAHLAQRFAIVASSREEALARLRERRAAGSGKAVPEPSALEDAARRYEAGEDLSWSQVAAGRRARRVSLPTYAFERERYWPEKPAGVPARSAAALPARAAAATQPAEPRALLDAAYEIRWTEVAAASQSARRQRRRTLVVADRGGVGAALVEELNLAGPLAQLVSLADGAPWDPLSEADQIVYLCHLDQGALADPTPGLGEVLRFVKAMASARAESRLWFVTRGSQQVLPSECPAPAHAALWAMAKVLPIEMPRRWGGLIDVEAGATPAAAGRQVAAALGADSEDQLAVRGTRMYAARLARFTVECSPPWSLHADATYLITGGQRGLGLEAARWLARHGARHLVLAGRTAVSEARTAEVLRGLTRDGVEVRMVTLDVTDHAALQRWIGAEAAAGHLAVRGIVHAAGVWRDRPLVDLSQEELAAVLAPKVTGTVALADSFPAVDFFVGFSAFSALLPAETQGNYAAANAFLDAFLRNRRGERPGWTSVNWGPWSDVGFATTEYGARAHQRLEFLGIRRVAPDDGFATLDALVHGHRAGLGIMPVDWQRLFERDPNARLSPLLRDLYQQFGIASGSGAPGRALALLERLGADDLVPALERELTTMAVEVLRLASREFGRTTSFTDLGVDSLMAVEMKNRIQHEAGVDVPLVKLLEGPSIADLAMLVAAHLKLTGLRARADVRGEMKELEI